MQYMWVLPLIWVAILIVSAIVGFMLNRRTRKMEPHDDES
jgi:hypothetical protein